MRAPLVLLPRGFAPEPLQLKWPVQKRVSQVGTQQSFSKQRQIDQNKEEPFKIYQTPKEATHNGLCDPRKTKEPKRVDQGRSCPGPTFFDDFYYCIHFYPPNNLLASS